MVSTVERTGRCGCGDHPVLTRLNASYSLSLRTADASGNFVAAVRVRHDDPCGTTRNDTMANSISVMPGTGSAATVGRPLLPGIGGPQRGERDGRAVPRMRRHRASLCGSPTRCRTTTSSTRTFLITPATSKRRNDQSPQRASMHADSLSHTWGRTQQRSFAPRFAPSPPP